MNRELSVRLQTLEWGELSSVYFGGGTPSVLSASEINGFISKLKNQYSLDNVEITLEANPDDLNKGKLKELKEGGINRISIGIQSFFEEDLRWMNRSHNALQAEQCLLDAADIGFTDINADLIFGYPMLSDDKWERNIAKMLAYPINHLSTYSMTVEPKTALAHAIAKKKDRPMHEGQAEVQYRRIMQAMQDAGWDHYEVSNFCKPGHPSKHNSGYWQGKEYLGIGPSAHGYVGNDRYWNIANNVKYLKSLNEGVLPEERETLSPTQKHNEYLLTRLRTAAGIRLSEFSEQFGNTLKERLLQRISLNEFEPYFVLSKDKMIMNKEGFLLADYLIGDLFLADD